MDPVIHLPDFHPAPLHSEQTRPYRGRFAPTPSGPLHFGSLVAAMASYLEARHHAGTWLLRIEDLDPPREVAGAADDILRTLDAFGFEWDEAVMYQSRRQEAYAAAIAQLTADGLVYGCTCSRKQLAHEARRGIDGPVYPGTCRGKPGGPGNALRLQTPDQRVCFEDALQGRVCCSLAQECGDFVLQRADGVYSYQLAVVVDDSAQDISHVVRGADLLTSTPRQLALLPLLQLPIPSYHHLPVVMDRDGYKLSKQTLATALDWKQPLSALSSASMFLGMTIPHDLAGVAEFWAWARTAWPDRQLPPIRGRRLPASLCNP